MWKINLKPFSAEFDSELNEEKKRDCDISGCPAHGEYRAPKSRNELNNHYWFCLDHIKDYNKNWNFFDGLPQKEVERHIYGAMTWDRPTWSFSQGQGHDYEERIRRQMHEGFRFTGNKAHYNYTDENEEKTSRKYTPSVQTPETEALSVMGLEPPIVWLDIREQYKKLMKKHHPDVNKNDKDSEELVKKINMSYSILKIAYNKFEKLEDQ